MIAPEPGARSAELRLPTRTAPIEQALVYARATRTVTERRVDIGDRVKKGDVLALVAAPEIDQAVDRARAAVTQTKAKEQPAQTNLARSQQLVEQGFLSRQVLDERVGNYDAAKADRLAAEAELPRLAEIRGFQVVRAPFAGVIDSRTGTMPVELSLPNREARLPAGTLGEVVIALPRAGEVLLVPNSTLVVRDGKAQVALVEKGAVIRFVPVRLGRNNGRRTEVLGGIARNASLVTNPNALLRDGDSVRVAQNDSAKSTR